MVDYFLAVPVWVRWLFVIGFFMTLFVGARINTRAGFMSRPRPSLFVDDDSENLGDGSWNQSLK